MTIDQTINQLIILRDRATEPRQVVALDDAIMLMRSKGEFYTLAYLRGWHDARKKEVQS